MRIHVGLVKVNARPRDAPMKTLHLSLLISLVTLGLAGCTTVQTYGYGSSSVSNNSYASSSTERPQAGRIQILYSAPQQAYDSLGTFSVRKYKPGWSDPTISDAIPELQAAARRMGADAVIIRSSTTRDTRFNTIEGEAIRWR